MPQLQSSRQPGFVSLIAVLMLLLITTAVGTSILLLSSETVFDSATLTQSYQAQALANACAEVALDKVKTTLSYAGNETIVTPSGNCQIVSVSGTGNSNRTINTQATVGSVTRKVVVVVTTVNQFTVIGSWREVADF